MNNTSFLTRCLARVRIPCVLALMAFGAQGNAAVPDSINYQGYLTNVDGTPVDGTLTMTFVAFNVDIGGAPLWNQTSSVTMEQGLFSVTLADPVNPFPAGLFDGPVYIGLFVAGEEMLPRRALTSNAYSFRAGDADTLNGLDAAALNQSAEVAALEGSVATVQVDIAGLQSDLSITQADVTGVFSELLNVQGELAFLGNDIAAVQTSVNDVDLSVGSNSARISTLEGVGADITGVTAGSGLIGGGVAGNVSLGIGAGSITNDMLGFFSVRPENIDSTAQFTFDDLTARGELRVWADNGESLFVTQNDSTGQLLTFTDAFGGTEGGLGMRSYAEGNVFEIFVDNLITRVFTASADGVTLANASPVAGYSVSVPDLHVAGTLGIGHQIVSVTFDVNTTVAACPSYGGGTCHVGSALVFCPTGSKVMGGGLNGNSARWSSVGASYPNGETGWICEAAYDITTTRTCYAICANVD